MSRQRRGSGETHFLLTVALTHSHQTIAQMLLNHAPRLVFELSAEGVTMLHIATQGCKSTKFIEKIWRMNPVALYFKHPNTATNLKFPHTYNDEEEFKNKTPFDLAVARKKRYLVDLWERKFSLEDIHAAFDRVERSCNTRTTRILAEYVARPLLKRTLPADVVNEICEYYYYPPARKATHNKNVHISSSFSSSSCSPSAAASKAVKKKESDAEDASATDEEESFDEGEKEERPFEPGVVVVPKYIRRT